MNQMVSQIMGQQSNPIVQAWEMIKTSKNPQQALINALGNTKDGPNAIEMLKRNNGDAEKAFYEYAQQQMIDGNQFLASLKSMGLN